MYTMKVFGHLNPDTDSTCSAIVYAWFLKESRGIEATPYVLGSLNKEATYLLDRFKVEVPQVLDSLSAGEAVTIVDTNNPEELPADIAQASIAEIIDHHKLIGGLSTSEPLSVTMRPVACTATIIWQVMNQEEGLVLPQHIASLMVAAIVSDTLKFTSPTTTAVDQAAAKALAEQAGIDIDELANGMFAAKSDLSGMSANDLLLMDSKIFKLGGKSIRVSSLETTKPDNALAMADQLVEAMEAMKKEAGLDGVFFFIVDILQSKATLLVSADFEREIAENGFGKIFSEGVMELPGVVSRKKQIIPALEKALTA